MLFFSWNAYKVIAQEITSTSPDRRKWIGMHVMSHYDVKHIYELFNKFLHFKYCLLAFEMSRKIFEDLQIYDSDLEIDEDISINYLQGFNTEEELYKLCDQLAVAPEMFVPPWRCNYPLAE
ncbi:hypothetical protein IC235_08775 [Hymenobacter sp. BT664]|uniref:Uncharacterized protein n=1 Tax=Hymenobacter montanus TaxID=2771359 RepID=A0A927BCY0_9BACT|nr:hypothetical protein [Hymenobacter montanus]MBD2767985.1 hypothetical protein [Hymenobacter montanus]